MRQVETYFLKKQLFKQLYLQFTEPRMNLKIKKTAEKYILSTDYFKQQKTLI